MKKVKQLWCSLPHPAQAIILAFVAAFGESLAHALSEPNMTFSEATVLHLLKGAIVAGVVAARAFYMVPNRASTQQGSNLQLPQSSAPSGPRC